MGLGLNIRLRYRVNPKMLPHGHIFKTNGTYKGIWGYFPSRDKNMHKIAKLQFCHRSHFLSCNNNFMQTFVHIIWVCKHPDIKFEIKKQFRKYVKNYQKIR